MKTRIQPYVMFEGRCEEALEFYKQALGAEVTALLRNRESPDPHPPGMLPPGSEEKIMHAELRIGETTVMASDGRCSGQPNFAGITLSIIAPDDAVAERCFAALAPGGTVRQPLMTTFFSSRFGMLTDRFGVPWMVVVL
jgi:PhnB protein